MFLVPHFTEKLIEQLYLVGAAMTMAILIGVPLGILIVRTQRLRAVVLSFAGILQTIPSLALLAFLLPFFGIGAKPAIIALVLYALLPVIRNTVTGLENVPAESIEAARGLGFTKLQRLWIVELPLAMPMIIAGIRIATVISVGVATLAAFIGAGGLGDFINRGLALNNTQLLLIGAIPAALMALILDFVIGQIEILLQKNKSSSKAKTFLALGFIGVLLALSLFAASAPFWEKHHNSVRIGTKNFTEQFILGEIIAQLVEAKTHLQVERYFNLGATEILQLSLVGGQIDIYPEYTGTAYLTVLNLPYTGLRSKPLFEKVKTEYAQRFKVSWLQPLGFNNTQAIAVRDEFAVQYQLKTISDLVPMQQWLIMGAPPEFVSRPDALPGLEKAYGLHFGKIKQLEPNLMYLAIFQKQVNTVMAFSTDGRIEKYHLRILQDDKNLFPPYDASILIRQNTLEKYPELKVLELLSGKIDDRTMRTMNYQVDVEKKAPAEVAKAFLQDRKLID